MSTESPGILVVEDETRARAAVQDALRGLDAEVRFVGDGQSALTAARARAPSLLLIDIAAGIDFSRLLAELRTAVDTMPRLVLFARDPSQAVPPSIVPPADVRSACVLALAEWSDAQDDWEREEVGLARGRIAAERSRLESLGLLDAKGRALTNEIPNDMKPGSKTDVTTS